MSKGVKREKEKGMVKQEGCFRVQGFTTPSERWWSKAEWIGDPCHKTDRISMDVHGRSYDDEEDGEKRKN